jgi:hypothetical protein
MKMDNKERDDLVGTIAREDINNLKLIQKIINKEINYRMDNIEDCMPTAKVPVGYSVAAAPVVGYCANAVPQQEVKKMNTANSMAIVTSSETIEERRISFLVNQLESAKHRKDLELQRHFGLIGDERPATATELVERIKDGLYVIPEHGKDVRSYYSFDYIEWRNPKIKKDQEGYNKAEKEMQAEAREANRTIVLSDPEKGRSALEKFEKSKFH